jgi:hypothetical protein
MIRMLTTIKDLTRFNIGFLLITSKTLDGWVG